MPCNEELHIYSHRVLAWLHDPMMGGLVVLLPDVNSPLQGRRGLGPQEIVNEDKETSFA